MHYKNGTPAKSGDAVILRRFTGEIAAGMLHSLNPGATTCNGMVAIPVPGGVVNDYVTVGDIYPAEAAFAAVSVQDGPLAPGVAGALATAAVEYLNLPQTISGSAGAANPQG